MTRRAENCVYVMVPDGGEGPIKVGSSRSPEGRQCGLSIFAGRRMILSSVWIVAGDRADAFRVELEAHRILKAHLVRGREWFEAERKLADEAIQAGARSLGLKIVERAPIPPHVTNVPCFGKIIQDVLNECCITREQLEAECAAMLVKYGDDVRGMLGWSL